jgi:uncharacterized protein YcfL
MDTLKMKNLLILVCIAALLVSCGSRQDGMLQDQAAKRVATTSAYSYHNTIRHFVRQFDFDPSAIYGDMFINKSWQ